MSRVAFLLLLGLAAPQAAGERDMVVTGTTAVGKRELKVKGDLIVRKGGRLLLKRTTLVMDSPARPGGHILVEKGGELALDGAEITCPEGRAYDLIVDEGATFSMQRSTVRRAGWKDQAATDEGRWIAAPFTNDTTRGGHGMELYGKVLAFSDNTIEDVASVRFFGSGLTIERNTVKAPRHEGLAFINSNDNIVRENVIEGKADGTREIYGLRFYPGARNQKISKNTIRGVVEGIKVATVPEWRAGEDFEIHHNTVREVFRALAGTFRKAHIHHEDYRSFAGGALGLNASTDVVVEDCRIEDATHVFPALLDPEYYERVKAIVHPTAASTYFDFALRRGGIEVSWRAEGIVIRRNVVRNIPRHGYGITTDVKNVAVGLAIEGNTFETISVGGLPEPHALRPPRIGGVPGQRGAPRPPGAAIELEHSDDVKIEKNVFVDCLNGVATVFPDAIGNAGDVSIVDNRFEVTVAGAERMEGDAGSAVYMTSDFYSHSGPDPDPTWSDEIKDYFKAACRIQVRGNRIDGYPRPLVLHTERPASVRFEVAGNRIRSYKEILVPEGLKVDGTE